jgi:hypothetical protein
MDFGLRTSSPANSAPNLPELTFPNQSTRGNIRGRQNASLAEDVPIFVICAVFEAF